MNSTWQLYEHRHESVQRFLCYYFLRTNHYIAHLLSDAQRCFEVHNKAMTTTSKLSGGPLEPLLIDGVLITSQRS